MLFPWFIKKGHVMKSCLPVFLFVPVLAFAQTASLFDPPRHVGPPLPEQAVTNRAFTGIPSMAVTPGGRLWADWYAGPTPGEDSNNYVVLSTSGDGGKTWRELTPSAIPHPSARFFITRLRSGNLLLVKHGPLDQRTGRSLLTAYRSSDEGKTWSGGLLLDERNGVSYPDGQQTADGLIRIIYDFDRTRARNILMAAFREEDVAAGKAVSGTVALRQVVSQGSGGQAPPLPPVDANSDGTPLVRAPAGAWACEDASDAPFVRDVMLFVDRDYACGDVPDVLKAAHFLRVRMNGQKTLRCARDGMLYMLTPLPDRNRDSVSKALADQGFQKVLLPEVRLFAPTSPANFCTLFQKACRKGDTVLIGKWGVPLFFP